MRSQPEPGELWTAVRAAPDDTTLKLVLADYLDESDQPRMACAVRWCVGRGRWPRLTKTMACWYTEPSADVPGSPEEISRARLPLFFFVVGGQCERRDQLATVRSGIAFDTLAKALDYLGYVLEALQHWTAREEA
jgi:uncharacterized protein (TIGR02996 family)